MLCRLVSVPIRIIIFSFVGLEKGNIYLYINIHLILMTQYNLYKYGIFTIL